MLNSIFLMLQSADVGTAVQDTLTNVAASADAIGEELNLWQLTKKGGWWIMGPLAILFLVSVYIFIERLMASLKATKDETQFMQRIRDMIHDGKVDSAKDLCKTQSTPLATMVLKGISRLGRPLPDVNQAIENVGKLEVSKLEKNVATLATVAGAAPMMGFLGTVVGMVRVFFDMANSGNNLDIQLLSNGMYQAMVTTIAGLTVGIISYIFYNVIVARIDKVVFILEARATEFMDVLHEPANN